MIAIEFAFLALGLVLGVAGGAALVMVLGSRKPSRQVRLTVSHDAVPRRGSTLASDAFSTSPSEPARGGPADRRRLDRADSRSGEGEAGDDATRDSVGNPRPGEPASRTVVPFAPAPAAQVGIAIEPERDGALDALRVKAAEAAAMMYRSDLALASAADDRPETGAVAMVSSATRTATSARPETDSVEAIDATPALIRILRGDRNALRAVSANLSGTAPDERRSWESAIYSMCGAITDRAIGEGWLDFHVGNPFWDGFTIAQCRAIAGALGAAGHRFDGIDGWADGRIPNYRDLTIAVGDAGVEPRRIRGWPTQEQIDDLFLEVTAAPDDYLAANAPNLDLEEIRALVGIGGSERARIWAEWDRVRAVLMAEVPAPEVPAGEARADR